MILDLLIPLKRFFRSPATIVGELLFITAASIAGASFPQAGHATAAEVARLREHGALVTSLVQTLALDHVFTSPAFLIALGLATVSLSIVVVEQVRRLRAQWKLVPAEAAFRNAPFRREFARPAQGAAGTVSVRTTGRLGLAGSPLFHMGLLCVILAGALRALFGAEAVVDLYEGETLPATVEAWGAQWPGAFGKPFQLDVPLLLTQVDSTRYESGDLKGLRLKLTMQHPEGARIHDLEVNRELRTSRGRLYMDAKHGPAALVEWETPGAPALRVASLMEQKEPLAFGTYLQGPRNLRARLRAVMPPDGRRPDSIEVRVLDGPSTLVESTLKPGGSLAVPGGGLLRLHGLPAWARLHGNTDPALGLVYAGFFMALAGATLTFGVVKVDELVSVAPEEGRERVVVAMRPHRFAPLFQDRFERLVRQNGGQP